MIHLDDVIAGNHQYSCKCGWIDNDHASMMPKPMPEWDIRLDVIKVWEQFPGQAKAKRSPGGRGWLVEYIQPVGRTSLLVPFSFPKLWFVKDLSLTGSDLLDRHRGIALRLYQLGNDSLESYQGFIAFQKIKHSSFSYEDLSSDMIAWYRGVMGYTRDKVKEICQVVSRDESIALAVTMDINSHQEQNKDWNKALLFNAVCPHCAALGSSVSGLADMPAEFRKVTPGSVSFQDGVGDAWPYMFRTSERSEPSPDYPSYDLPPGYHVKSLGERLKGIFGGGKPPGPLGKS